MKIDDNIAYAKRNIVDSIWKEAHIEGIACTFPETQEIYEGRTVAGMSIDDAMAINNLKHAWQLVFDTIGEPIDLEYIQLMNYKIGEGGVVPYAGDVWTGGHGITGTSWRPTVPDPERIRGCLGEILAIGDPTERALEMLAFICRAQIFRDGNKRTAQLIANRILIENGCGILAIPIEEKAQFGEELIRYYETGDATALTAFLRETSIDNPVIEPEEYAPDFGKWEKYRFEHQSD